MKIRRIGALFGACLFGLIRSSIASVPVEQIEAYEVQAGDNYSHPTRYAPINFSGATSVTLASGDAGGVFGNQTFFASSNLTNTASLHAWTVGLYFYGVGSPAFPYVNTIYDNEATNFLVHTVKSTWAMSATGTIPGDFDGGAKVINSSWIMGCSVSAANDIQRRLDFMINKDDVTYVTSAVSSVNGSAPQFLTWTSFNALSISGQQSFDPSTSPGKQHADLGGIGDASFVTAQVSSDAAALYGNAQGSGQTDALHGFVIKSLLMGGASRLGYVPQTANNLSVTFGAGSPDYDNSLSILQAGETSLSAVAGGVGVGLADTAQKGWTTGTIAPGSQSAILFQAGTAITGITASLNWNLTESQPTATTIDTTAAGVIFPNLTLEVRPVTYIGGVFQLGAVSGDATLHSAAPGDNVQFIYSCNILPAGTYAFLVGGDAVLPATIGLSYSLNGTFSSQWNGISGSWVSKGLWSNSAPNGQAAVANLTPFLQILPGTLTLDGNKTIGQMNLGNLSALTIASGSGGTLTFDDTGDSSGTANPLINLTAGNITISVPVKLANGLNVKTTAGTAVSFTAGVTGSGTLTMSGAGRLTIPAGTNIAVPIRTTANVSVSANVTALIVPTSISSISIGGGATFAVASPSTGNGRTVLVVSALGIDGGDGAWLGQLDLGANDLIIHNGALSTITSELREGSANGGWTGQGISSSAAAISPGGLGALGVILNSDSQGDPLYTTFDGQLVGATDVLVRYTAVGDGNLDGVVDGSDYTTIDQGYNSGLAGWNHGDFNYDGVVNGSDYTLIDDAFNQQSQRDSMRIAFATTDPASPARIPEPALLLSVTGLCLGLGLRHQRGADRN